MRLESKQNVVAMVLTSKDPNSYILVASQKGFGKLSKIELNVKANKSEKSSNLSSNEKYFSIIAGSFRSKNNAENKLNSLIKEGYKAEMAKKSSEGFHRVAYGRFVSKKKAINLLIFVKYTLQEEAWFLEE